MYRKIIKVFLGSPGDLEDERKAAKVVVDEENANHANELGYHIDLVGWEDTVSQRRRAQDAINVDLDQCEYFVGLMWKKWGTPPGPKGHPYSSGFEEEYRRSVERHEKTGKPEISLLFKNVSEDDLVDVGKQLEKVLKFQEEINEEKKGYYQKFENLRDFEQKFRAIIAKFITDQQFEDQISGSNDPQKPKPIEVKGNDEKGAEDSKPIFESEARNFLNDFLNREAVTGAYNATEAARFMLLACIVSQPENDRLDLGTHDANLIYRDLRNSDLSDREKTGLVSAGLESLESSTVPIWHWLFQTNFKLREELPLRTVIYSDKKRRNTFRLLEKLSIAPNDFEGPFDWTDYQRYWFADEVSNDLIVAALEYLGSVGHEKIELNWSKLIGSSEANIARAAVCASTRITARTNTAEALRFVAHHESTDLGKELTDELLKNINTIETEVLRGCLKNKTAAFVKVIANELSRRTALTKADAQLLCENADAEIRLIGAKALATQDSSLTLQDAQKLLVKPRKSKTFNFLTAPKARDFPGESALTKFKIDALSKLPFVELTELQKDESFYSTEITLAIYSTQFKAVKDELGKDLVDGFEKFFTERRVPLLGTSAEPSVSVFDFVRDGLLQSAFEVYCSRAAKSDLVIVRKVIDKHDIKFAPPIAEFLSKNGEWEDAVRLAKLSRNFKFDAGLSLLSIVDHASDYRLAARSILKLSSKRIADAWKMELSTAVRVQLVAHMPKQLFSAFDNQSIIDMLLMQSDLVREAIALKAVQCLSKSRLSKILDAYYNVDGNYFYNAIFWLDLGISADRTTSKAIALKEIAAK